MAPQDAAQWSPLATLYNDNRRYREALAAAGDILLLQPENPSVQNQLGIAQFGLNRIPDAVKTFQKALAARPDDITARYYLGLCYQKLKQPQEAIKQFAFVYQCSPGYQQTRLMLGNLYLSNQRAADARRLLAEAHEAEERSQKTARGTYLVSTRPRDPQAHFQMAHIYAESGDAPRAIAELRKTLELAPAHAEAQKLLKSLQAGGKGDAGSG